MSFFNLSIFWEYIGSKLNLYIEYSLRLGVDWERFKGIFLIIVNSGIIMRMTGRVDNKNRVTISKTIREDLALSPREEIKVNIKDPEGGLGRSATVRLDDQGRVTIPEHIRNALGIEAGDTVEINLGSLNEDINYWDVKTWNDLFFNLSYLASSKNPIVKLKKRVDEEWDHRTLAEVYHQYEEFFQPEKKSEAEIQKPWFLRFFDIGFFSQGQEIETYDGIVFRLEEGTGLEDVEIRVRERRSAPSRYFTDSNSIEEALEIAEEGGFGIKEKEPEEIELSSPRKIAEKIRSFFQFIMNSILGHELWLLILSLSHGPTEKYAKNCYEGFDEDLIFDKLEFQREPNFGLLKAGSYDSLSNKFVKIWNKLTDTSDIKKVAECVGFEPIPDPQDDYLQQNYRSFKEGNFEKARSLLQKIKRSRDGLPYGSPKVGKLAREIEVPIGDLLRGLAPLLFLGILTYSNGQIDFSRLRELEGT